MPEIPIMVDDYRAKCCGTCRHGSVLGLACTCGITGELRYVSRYGVCMKNYEMTKRAAPGITDC